MKRKFLPFGLFLLILFLLTGCSSSGNYYRSGKKNFVAGNYEVAADNFSKAIAINPNRSEYYIDYGMSLIALGQYEEAIELFDTVYRDKNIKIIRENNKRIYRGKGIAYYYLKQYQKAIEQFDQALQIDELTKLTMDILYYKGNSLKLIGKYKEASEAYTMLLAMDGKAAEALAKRADIYRILGEYEKGLADYDAAIKQKPDYFPYYFGKYYLLKDSGKEAEGNAVLASAGSIKVRTEEDQVYHAILQYYLGNNEIALKKLNECIEQGYTQANYYIGEINREQKKYKEAVSYYEKFIEEGVNLTSDVYNQLGTCFMKLGDEKRALSFFEEGIKFQNPETLRVLRKNEIIAYERLGSFVTAGEKLQEYLSSYPSDKEALREEEFLKTRLVEVGR